MNLKKKLDIWICDLTHTEQGIVSRTFPLGASCVFTYAKKELGNEFNFRLFKFPSKLNEALRKKSPAMLCFSNYKWNFELLEIVFAKKEISPSLLVFSPLIYLLN